MAQLKAPVPLQNVRRPVAPPVYRPQPIPKVLQTKSALPLSPQKLQLPRQPVAPPVFRPPPAPKILQPKLLPTQIRPTVRAPPVPHRLVPVPKVVQTKNQPAPAVKLGATVQLASRSRSAKKKEVLKRTPFSAEVKREVEIKKGEHRRHIIPNHLMRHMLLNWWNAHKDDDEGEKTSVAKLEKILKDLNNYIPNLIPGDGASNSAIGMLSTAIGGRLDEIKAGDLSASEVGELLSRYRGFVQWKQKELMKGVLRAFEKDDEIKSSAEERVEVAEDVHFSTDFDWPGGRHFGRWFGSYERFKEIEAKPGAVSYGDLMKAVDEFQSLPVVRDGRDRSPDPGRGRTRDRMQSRRRSESRDERSLSPAARGGGGGGGGSRDRSRSRGRPSGPAGNTRSRRYSS